MALYTVDCSKFPSDKACDLKITGSDKEAVIDTAYQHAIGPMHNNKPSEALKGQIRQAVEGQAASAR